MSRITKDHFSFICPMSWDEMAPSENGRFCTKCSKEVFDLTDCSLGELHELQRKRGKICGMIKLTGAAAVAAASLGSAACRNSADPSEHLPGQPLPPDPSKRSQYDVTRTMGVMVCPPDSANSADRDADLK